jgi:hypothetical protein
LNPRDWACDQVVEWLAEEVQLEQYVQDFLRARVDGAMLFRLADNEGEGLERMLRIPHPLHRRKLLLAIRRLKDREVEELGLSVEELDAYIAKLDRTRLAFVARLKAVFDAEDKDGAEELGPEQLQAALLRLCGEEGERPTLVKADARGWWEEARLTGRTVSFPDFVDKVTRLMVRDEGDGKAAAGADKKRIRLVDGHVQLRAASPSRGKKDKQAGSALEQVAKGLKGDEDDEAAGEEEAEGSDGAEGRSRPSFRRRREASEEREEDEEVQWDSITKVSGAALFPSHSETDGIANTPTAGPGQVRVRPLPGRRPYYGTRDDPGTPGGRMHSSQEGGKPHAPL